MIYHATFDEVYYDKNFPALIKEYGEECSALGVPEPQPELYRMLEASGGLQVFSAFDNGELVGFGSVLVYVLPHFGRKIASSESVFISKTFRGTGLGITLIETMKDYARKRECEKLLFSAPVGSQFDSLLKMLHPHISNVYMVAL